VIRCLVTAELGLVGGMNRSSWTFSTFATLIASILCPEDESMNGCRRWLIDSSSHSIAI
jgi:hypothetical protein